MIKKISFLAFGITLIIVGSYLSTIPYNALSIFATVHEFSFACLSMPLGFAEAYDNPHQRGTCNENYILSSVLSSFIIGGMFLIYKSKIYLRQSVP